MKNKNLIIGLVVGLAVLVGAGIMILSSNKTPPEMDQTPIEDQVSTIDPSEIGLTLSMSSDNREVIINISNTEGISGLDYELSYISKGDIPRGVIGIIDIVQAGKPVTKRLKLGTCSDVCHYDEDVSNIKLILKVTKTDGTTGQVEKSLEL